jgi:hypothetical protein
MTASHAKVRLFVVVSLASVAVAAGYTFYAARAPKSQAAPVSAVPVGATTSPAASASLETSAPSAAPASIRPPEPQPRAARPPSAPDHTSAKRYLVALNVRDSPDLGQAEYSALDSIDARTVTGLRCERVYFAAGHGVCLSRQVKLFAAETIATFTDDRLQPVFDLRTPGIPSRARISPDGRRAAFTVFVTGHSYADVQLSTTTLLVDLVTHRSLANLEEFQVWREGTSLQARDFNYWGVTFEQDSNFFYATLRTGGINYLVRGDITARTATVVVPGVECPSLSPDGKRIAFKKALARGDWRVAVLDLATRQIVQLPETRSVDDQVEWLDNARVLYAVPDPAPWMTIMVAPADGRDQPAVFVKGAASPAVVTRFRP